MKNKGLLIFLGIILVLGLVFAGMYNTMVNKNEAVGKAWGDVESAYQRRFDLVDNLSNIVKGAANFEQSTLLKVVEARSEAQKVQIDGNNPTQEQLNQLQAAQDKLKDNINTMIKVVVEQYPQLTATKNYQEFQSQLEGTENRINTARVRFNEAAQEYNATIKRFPQNIAAGIFGFAPRDYFKSDPGAEKAPKVNL